MRNSNTVAAGMSEYGDGGLHEALNLLSRGATRKAAALSDRLRNDTGLPLVVWAASMGLAEKLPSLLRHGCSPNEKGSKGLSALCAAVRKRSAGCVSVLLEAGVSPLETDMWGETMTGLACSKACPEGERDEADSPFILGALLDAGGPRLRGDGSSLWDGLYLWGGCSKGLAETLLSHDVVPSTRATSDLLERLGARMAALRVLPSSRFMEGQHEKSEQIRRFGELAGLIEAGCISGGMPTAMLPTRKRNV